MVDAIKGHVSKSDPERGPAKTDQEIDNLSSTSSALQDSSKCILVEHQSHDTEEASLVLRAQHALNDIIEMAKIQQKQGDNKEKIAEDFKTEILRLLYF